MNNTRRKALTALQEQLQALRGKIEDIGAQVESLRDEEQEYLDNMPESLAEGDKGSAAQEAIDALEAVMETCSEMDGNFEDVEQAFETATA